MPKSSYIPFNDDAFAAQLQTFKSVIPDYATALGLAPAQVTAQAADADYFSYVLATQQLIRNSASQWVGWKDILRSGDDLPPSGPPVPPTISTVVAPVEPGVEVRFRALVKQIKGHPAYNAAMGAALGIEGSQQTGPDYDTLAPDIKASISGGHVFVDWNWSGFSAFLDICELQVDRTGAGTNFAPLAFTPPPATSTPSPSPPLPRNGPTAPSTASATNVLGSGVNR